MQLWYGIFKLVPKKIQKKFAGEVRRGSVNSAPFPKKVWRIGPFLGMNYFKKPNLILNWFRRPDVDWLAGCCSLGCCSSNSQPTAASKSSMIKVIQFQRYKTLHPSASLIGGWYRPDDWVKRSILLCIASLAKEWDSCFRERKVRSFMPLWWRNFQATKNPPF